MNTSENLYQKKTILGYELSYKQHIVLNFLIPSLGSFALYVLIISFDIGVVFRHYKEENLQWASLTILFMYLPAIASYAYFISSTDLWPDEIGFGLTNILWAIIKTFQHFMFPVWSMWRYAERIFWAIEGVRTEDEEDKQIIDDNLTAPRSIELYAFLQSFLHSLPQILFQISILMRHEHDLHRVTITIQILSCVFNLFKVSVTTAFFQRFKTQKLAGRQYPWFKSYKKHSANEENNGQSNPCTNAEVNSPLLEQQTTEDNVVVPAVSNVGHIGEDEQQSTEDNVVVPAESNVGEDEVDFRNKSPESGKRPFSRRITIRRSSSDFYLAPKLETPNFFQRHVIDPVRRFNQEYILRETSVVDGPKRCLYSEPDFNIRRLRYIKGLPEDDFAGKVISFCWWFGFLLARILAISAFSYFYPKPCLYLLLAHFILIIIVLLYDYKTGDLKRSKLVFFVFIGYIFIFCVIEFKIRFKKAKIIYYLFFTLVFAENFSMCLVWWFTDMDNLDIDFWFRYIFIIIVMCSIFSLFSMLFYLNINKPKKVIVKSEVM